MSEKEKTVSSSERRFSRSAAVGASTRDWKRVWLKAGYGEGELGQLVLLLELELEVEVAVLDDTYVGTPITTCAKMATKTALLFPKCIVDVSQRARYSKAVLAGNEKLHNLGRRWRYRCRLCVSWSSPCHLWTLPASYT